MNRKLMAGFLMLLAFRVTYADNCSPNTEIWTMSELQNFIQTVKCVDGELLVAPSDAIEYLDLNFPLLTKVTGGISFGGGEILRELRMENLKSVGGNIFISMASYPQTSLRLVSLPNLTEFGGVVIDLSSSPKLLSKDIFINPAAKNQIQKN